MEASLSKPYWALKIAFGAVPIVAGVDKFLNLLTDWSQYLSPWVSSIVPASVVMPIVGVIEIAAGILVLSKWTRLGAYVVSAWLVAISLSLLTTGKFFDIAARDLVLAIGAFTLAKMAELKEPARTTTRVRATEPVTA